MSSKFLNANTDVNLGTADDQVPSQKAVKTYVDNKVPEKDSKSITANSSDQLQTVGVINDRDSSTAIKTWTGTLSQYNAIATKDSNTLYNITDDSDVPISLLETIYPVGATFMGTTSTCPLASLFGTWVEVTNELNSVIESGTVDGVTYRTWQDGYCEQSGSITTSGTSWTVTFAKAFTDTSYNPQVTPQYNSSPVTASGSACGIGYNTKTVSGFTVKTNTTWGKGISWSASGYLASGQYTPKTNKVWERTA